MHTRFCHHEGAVTTASLFYDLALGSWERWGGCLEAYCKDTLQEIIDVWDDSNETLEDALSRIARDAISRITRAPR